MQGSLPKSSRSFDIGAKLVLKEPPQGLSLFDVLERYIKNSTYF